MIRKNDSGFSIIEFLITLATLAIGAYKALEFLDNQKSEILLIHQNIEIQAIKQDIRRILLNPDHCTSSLEGKTLTTPEGEILNLNRVSIIENQQYVTPAYPISTKKEASYGPSRLRIQSYALQAIDENKTKLVIKFDQSFAQSKNNPKFKEESFDLFTKTGPDKEILRCSLTPIQDMQKFWDATSTPILSYNKGNIGILNPTPQVTVDIIGKIQFIRKTINTDCNETAQGLLEVHQQDGRLMFCNGEKWMKF